LEKQNKNKKSDYNKFGAFNLKNKRFEK
jgi:hypothetical protein